MRFVILLCVAGAVMLQAQDSRAAGDFQKWLDRGIREYKAARYPDAADAFQKTVDLNPNDVAAWLYLADAWMAQYIPGAQSPENLDIGRNAESAYERVLALDSNNVAALESLASLSFQEAQAIFEADKKSRKLEETAARYERLLGVDPRNKNAYYSLGVIDWAIWFPHYMRARMDLGMRPEQPGPLPDAAIRQRLLEQYGARIDHGITNLQKALELDPLFAGPMSYMNLLIRERADLRDSAEEYRRDTDTADRWVEKALEARRASTTQAGISGRIVEVPPPPPPPPAAEAVPAPSSAAPPRIMIGAEEQAQKLIRKVDPVYPKFATEARIQGSVRFTVIVARDGTINNMQLISGHPLLIEAARQAVSQYVYRPTLLNGELVEVVTSIAVNFSLGLQVPR